MGIEKHDNTTKNTFGMDEDSEEEGELDLEEEFLGALKELRQYKKKTMSLKI
jgi:hypothetical protein